MYGHPPSFIKNSYNNRTYFSLGCDWSVNEDRTENDRHLNVFLFKKGLGDDLPFTGRNKEIQPET